MSLLRIEKYSRKPLVGRRQYHARLVHNTNGEAIWRTSEGYNNRDELEWAITLLTRYAPQAEIVDLDETP